MVSDRVGGVSIRKDCTDMIVKMSDIRKAKVLQASGCVNTPYVVIYKGGQRLVVLLNR